MAPTSDSSNNVYKGNAMRIKGKIYIMAFVKVCGGIPAIQFFEMNEGSLHYCSAQLARGVFAIEYHFS
jgi:hypothetical protein